MCIYSYNMYVDQYHPMTSNENPIQSAKVKIDIELHIIQTVIVDKKLYLPIHMPML